MMLLLVLSAICLITGILLWMWAHRKIGPARGRDLRYDEWICAYASGFETAGYFLGILGAFGVIMSLLLMQQ